jgi:glutamine synthetase
MQNHLTGAIAVMAPYVNSYRRYVPDFSAPINLEWGRDNRTTGLRIPISSAAGRRVENRLPGMDCNPYLGIASTLACGSSSSVRVGIGFGSGTTLGLREMHDARAAHCQYQP